MNSFGGTPPFVLKQGTLIDLDSSEGSRITCLAGARLWITQAGDLRDIVLAEGQSFVLDRPGLALVCALGGDALVAVEPSTVSLPRAA